ncbi:hypothetical protein [Mucilaginibacter sp. OK098]|uniref:nSTAND3 domain-containing NTPase n=1 Tax=Mucilaginibacter sp. OK098 TaxID=1855297 RepID=UPI00091FCC0D|nr:hypothetical protein [Mucilaginibacter sp. OK098]SHM93434.1 hypothetical protein SAMN05216524_104172 [Mucilaginibacter sp. OK098]
MLTIELIESKLKIMNPDAFHRLCDHYLFFEGEDEFDSIVPVGQVEGKQKARKGTPDTRIRRSDGSYIFIQYTTQENYQKSDALLKKLEEDLIYCFDARKTKVGLTHLGLVILCFNSNIGNAEEQKLINIAWAKGKRLQLINLSTLAHKIVKDYPFLAKEYLGIEIDTYQLLPVKKFIEEYEKGGIATPLSNPFLYRENELKAIENSVESNMITIVSGKAGVGKTKLVVENLRAFTKKHRNYQAYCIRNKDQPLLSDLRRQLSAKNKKYLIFIDDANKSIAQLRDVLTFYQENQTEFKLILTVRDYVLKDIEPFLQGYQNNTISIKVFDSQQIKEIVKTKPFSIRHPLFLERIREVARGNPRLAIMTAIAAKDRTLDELNNVAEIYKLYFERISGDNPILAYPEYLRVLGVLAFFRTIDREDNRVMENILPAFGLNENDFWTKLYELERHEIVDVFTDRSSARFSDQILEGYLFFRVFFIDKLLDYGIILERFFPDYSGRVKYTAIDANNTFGFEDFGNLIKPFIFQKLQQILENRQDAAPFLSIFWYYLQDETLLYIKQQIDGLPEIEPLVLEDRIATARFNEKTFGFAGDTMLDKDAKDDLLELTTPFLHHLTDDFDLATGLMFGLIEKKPLLAERVVREIKSYFNFSVKDGIYHYYREERFAHLLIEKSTEDKPVFTYLFLKLVPHFLKTRFDTTYSEGRNINISYIEPNASSKFLEIRALFWKRFNEVYDSYPSLSLFSFKAVLDTFGPDFQKEVRTSDWAFIEAVFDQHFDYDKFQDVYAINEFVSRGARMGLDKKLYSETQKKAQTPDYKRFLALDYNQLRNRERFSRDGQDYNDWHKWFAEEKKKEILKTFNHRDIDGYKQTFAFINHCTELQLWEFYTVNNGAQILFNAALEKGVDPLELVTYLIHLTQFNRFFSFERLFNFMRDLAPGLILELGKVLNDEDYPNKPYVLLAYFNTLGDNYINKACTADYLELLAKVSGRFYLYFGNVTSYLRIDPLFLIKALRVLLANSAAGISDFILHEEFLERHVNDIRNTGLLEQVYLAMIAKEDHYDHDGSELMVVLKRRPSFYLKFLEQLASERSIDRSGEQKIAKVWDLENAFPIVEKAVNYLATHQRYHYHAEELLSDLLENTIKAEGFRENRLLFLKAYIQQNAGNMKRMKAIFKAVGTKVQEHFAELLEIFLKENKRFDHFEKIRWDERGVRVISGDAISAEIDERAWQRVKAVLEKLQPGADYLEHRVFVGKQIAYCQRSAIRERKHNFLRDDY